MIGMVGGLETLCSQAYGGKHYAEMGRVLQRAALVITLCCIPMALLWLFSARLFIALGQDPDTSRLAQLYMILLIPQLFAMSGTQLLARYLQSQRVFDAFVPVFASRLGVHAVLLVALVGALGYSGGAVALSLSSAFGLAALAAFAHWRVATRKPPVCWAGFTLDLASPRVWEGILAFLRLGVPSMVMTSLEWWYLEALLLVAASLPPSGEPGETGSARIAVMGIFTSTILLCFRLPLAFAIVASQRVGAALGAGRPQAARRSALAALAAALAAQALLCLGLLAGRRGWGRLFAGSSSPEARLVAARVADAMPLFALATLGDAGQAVLSAACRGTGKQAAGVVVNAVAIYGAGLPAALLLAFRAGWGTSGLMAGLGVANFGQFVGLAIMLFALTDWEAEAGRAEERFRRLKAETAMELELAGAGARGAPAPRGPLPLGNGEGGCHRGVTRTVAPDAADVRLTLSAEASDEELESRALLG